MRVPVACVLLLLTTMFAGCLSFGDGPAPRPAATADPATDDVVVIAVVDGGFNPYHWDFVSAFMPQHTNDDPVDDLPLDQDPATWLPGHPGADAFTSYTSINVTLDLTDPDAAPSDRYSGGSRIQQGTKVREGLYQRDAEEWKKVQPSSADEVHMTWIPDTKIVGYVNFDDGTGFAAGSHGVGTTSVSVGNFHGTCPECLLVFVNGGNEVANEWVAQQDWIDLQTNSWGLSLIMRDRLYAGSDVDLQRASIERGQSIFFSAGNGQANTFTVPNPTLFSSQEGPDWIITVGAIHPADGSSYSGHGKPADIASVGSQYPSAGGRNVSAESTFGGTSNATPVTAGIYGRALYLLRREMAGPSRVQTNGTVSVGDLPCGSAAPDCATGDGILTVDELRTSLFRSARYTSDAWTLGITDVRAPVVSPEQRFLSEGHGSYWGRIHPADDWWNESRRIADHAGGHWYEEQDEAQLDWMVADSFCRQSLWGAWDHGYYGSGVPLPARDQVFHPMRTWFLDECPRSGKAVHDVVGLVNGR